MEVYIMHTVVVQGPSVVLNVKPSGPTDLQMVQIFGSLDFMADFRFVAEPFNGMEVSFINTSESFVIKNIYTDEDLVRVVKVQEPINTVWFVAEDLLF